MPPKKIPKRSSNDSNSKQTYFVCDPQKKAYCITIPDSPKVGNLLENNISQVKGRKANGYLSDSDVEAWPIDGKAGITDAEVLSPSGSYCSLMESSDKITQITISSSNSDTSDSKSLSDKKLLTTDQPIELLSSDEALENSNFSSLSLKDSPTTPNIINIQKKDSAFGTTTTIEEDCVVLLSPKGSDDESHIDYSVVKARRKRRAIVCSSDEEEECLSENAPKPIALSSSASSSKMSPLVFSKPIETSNNPILNSRLVYQDKAAFFNKATEFELITLLKLTEDMVKILIKARPFNGQYDVLNNLESSSKGIKISEKFDTFSRNLTSIDRLITKSKLCISGFKYPAAEYIKSSPVFLTEGITLKAYQITGVNWLLNMYYNKCGVILADEMGLGKTCQVISMIGKLVQEGSPGPHLIVVPSSVLDNWLNEFKKFCPSISVLGYRGSQAERNDFYYDLVDGTLDDYDVVISSYLTVSSSKYDRLFMRRMKFQSLILDEAQTVKNAKSQVNQSLNKLEVSFRLLLTGTPLQNNLKELMTLMAFINPELFYDVIDEQFLDSILRINAVDKNEENKVTPHAKEVSNRCLEKIRTIISPFILRRCKEQVLKDLPKKIEKVELCALVSSQRTRYSKELALARESFENSGQAHMSVSFSLRRIANHTMLFPQGYHFKDETRKLIASRIIHAPEFFSCDKDTIYEELQDYADQDIQELCDKHKIIGKFGLKNEEWMESGKVQWLKSNLPKMIEQGDRILIFSQFTMVLDILEKVMGTLGISFYRLDGETPVQDRQFMIDSFNKDSSIHVFMLSTQSGGTGINLTGANVVIIHDLDHNPQNDRQAEARAHRVGQVRDVTIYKLISEGTIEERILSIGKAKLHLHSSLSGDAVSMDSGNLSSSKESDSNNDTILQALREELRSSNP